MLEIGVPVQGVLEYDVKCPKCYRIFEPEKGLSICPSCKYRTQHPADIIWIARSRKYYYTSWNDVNDN